MDRHRLQRIGLAVLTLVAITLLGIAAAPLFEVEQGAEEAPQPPGTGGSDGQGEIDLPVSPTVLLTGLVLVGLAGLLTQFAQDPWDAFVSVLEGAVAFALIIGFWVGLLELFQNEPSEPAAEGAEPAARTLTPTMTAAGGYGDGASDPLALPASDTTVLAIALGVVTLLALLAWRAGAIHSVFASRSTPPEEDTEEQLTAVGRVAGDAADEIEAAEAPDAADNAIYRAWTEMVALVGVSDPQSDTPRAFARAATDAGMDPDDVSLLTRTFEAVRYGDEPLSDDRREQVTEVLRRMERSFGDESGERPADGVEVAE